MGIALFLFMIIFFCFFFFLGGIPLLGLLKIKKNGIRTNAKIFNVRQVSKESTRSTGSYSADIRFHTEEGRTVQSKYLSSGDYLTLFQHNVKDEAEIVYFKNDPNKFYFPKDKGDIGWSVICFVVGITGIIVTTFLGW